jgi:1-deoxy-D-xylulose-5-phosphate synthase
MVLVAAEAAQTLAARGIQATVVNCRFLKPHDRDVLQEVAEGHKKVLTIEEGAVLNGFGACMAREIDDLDVGHAVQVRCLGLPDRFIEHGAREALLHDLGLDAQGIVTEARRMLGDAVSSASVETA